MRLGECDNCGCRGEKLFDVEIVMAEGDVRPVLDS